MGKERFAFVDVEASGLMPGSYPVEVAWALADGSSRAMLVRPAQDWTADLWDPAAESMHGLSRDTVVEKGRPPIDVALAMNEMLAGRFVLSDAPSHDAAWLDMLFREAGEPRRFRVVSVARLLERLGFPDEAGQHLFEAARAAHDPSGQALNGALYLLKVFRAALDARQER